MSELNTCPECGLFNYACKCKDPIETRIPTSKEIHNYLDNADLGIIPNDSFVYGFKAGWWAHQKNLKAFLKANNQMVANDASVKVQG